MQAHRPNLASHLLLQKKDLLEHCHACEFTNLLWLRLCYMGRIQQLQHNPIVYNAYNTSYLTFKALLTSGA